MEIWRSRVMASVRAWNIWSGSSSSFSCVNRMTLSLREELLTSDLTSDRRVITEAVAPYRIVHANQAWCEATGFSADVVIGSSCKLLQGPETCKLCLTRVHLAGGCTSRRISSRPRPFSV